MKKIVIYILIFVMLLAIPMHNYNVISKGSDSDKSTVKTDNGVSMLDKLSSYDVQKAEKNVRKAEKDRTVVGDATVTQIKQTLKKIENGSLSYRNVFKNVCIAGDSLMNGLEAYNILNSNNLVTQVSASLSHLEQNIPKIVRMNPRVLIIHYGINMVGPEQYHIDKFINTYTKHIKTLKKSLPDTRIIVSLLFPVEKNVAKAVFVNNVGKYNSALKKMCKSLKVEYLDSSSVLRAHQECYGGDGIHLSKAFYSKYWLKFIIKEKGIIG